MTAELTSIRDELKSQLVTYHSERNLSHLGSCLSSLEILTALFWGLLQPQDHFILSKGHAVSLLYLILHKKGLLSTNDLKNSCRDGSPFGAHPPFDRTAIHPWWGFGSGSLGYGIGLGCGVALGKKIRGEPSHVYILVSEGDLNEGSTWESLHFAAQRGLNNLTVLFDHNKTQALGPSADIYRLEHLEKTLPLIGWEVLRQEGHDLKTLRIENSLSQKPRFLIFDTHKNNGFEKLLTPLEAHYKVPVEEKNS